MKEEYKIRESYLTNIKSGNKRKIFILERKEKFLLWDFYVETGYGEERWDSLDNVGRLGESFRYFKTRELAEKCTENLLND